MDFTVSRARPHELGAAMSLIEQSELSTHGVVESFGHYLVVRDDERLIGLCGLEVHDSAALLRSVAVDAHYRGAGVGQALVAGALDLARKMDLRALYLMTTTASAFFERCGFQVWPREAAPEGIRASWEFTDGLPRSAVLMKRDV
jgi:amino-acid N-acetyltransferase